MSATSAIQTKLYSVLNGDATLMALATGGVHDKTPQETAFPFIQIGEWTETRFNTFTRNGKDATITLHIYDRDTDTRWGFKRCQDILSRANVLLDYVTFAVTGYSTTVYIRYEDSNQLLDADDYTRHVIARYRIMVQV